MMPFSAIQKRDSPLSTVHFAVEAALGLWMPSAALSFMWVLAIWTQVLIFAWQDLTTGLSPQLS